MDLAMLNPQQIKMLRKRYLISVGIVNSFWMNATGSAKNCVFVSCRSLCAHFAL